MTPQQQAFARLAETLKANMKKRQFEVFFCPTKEDAFATVTGFFTPGCVVTCGGSETVGQLGLKSYLESSPSFPGQYLDRGLAKTDQEKREVFSKAVLADYYLMSANAITMAGELVNIDGYGNRVAALCFGPANVLVIAGMNKVVPDEAAARQRIRLLAAPPNAIRLNRKTPCAAKGICMDCYAPDCICGQIVTTRLSLIPGRIKVILVGEPLGY